MPYLGRRGAANFSFVLFKVATPKWGFRSALDRYYSLYASFSDNVIRDQGNWLVAVSNLNSIENFTDFGFRFDEGGGTAAECKTLSSNGVGIFPYIEPHLVHWTLPKGSVVDYAHIMAAVHACMAAGPTNCSQFAKAYAIQTVGVIDANGEYVAVSVRRNLACVRTSLPSSRPVSPGCAL